MNKRIPKAAATPPTSTPAETAPPAWPTLHSAALSSAPLARAHKLQLMLTQFMTRGLSHGACSAAVLPKRFDPQVWLDLQAMQQSVMRRLQQQQQGWLEGLAALAEEYKQSKQANTLSKYVEQEYNLVAQFVALLSNQAASMAGLLENIQVDYGYWMAQQLEPPESSASRHA